MRTKYFSSAKSFLKKSASKRLLTALLIILASTFAGPVSFGQAGGSAKPVIEKGGKIKPPTSAKTAMKSNSAGTIASVLEPNHSPLVTFRILFNTGSASDPEGKEGLASLTASMLAGGGSRRMSYDQITNEFYPMATSFGYQIDKEMTVFEGTTHLDNLDHYYS